MGRRVSAAATAAGYLYACGRIGKKNKPLDTSERLPELERVAPVAPKPAPKITYRKPRS